MWSWILLAIVLLAGVGSLLCASLAIALSDLSRVRFAEKLNQGNRSDLVDSTVEHAGEMASLMAIGRLVFNTAILMAVLGWLESLGYSATLKYALGVGLGGAIAGITSVVFATALAAHMGTGLVAALIGPLHFIRRMLFPLTAFIDAVDDLFRRAAGRPREQEHDEIHQEIVSVVEEAEKEGVVGEDEREMIESVIEFRDTTAAQIMTSRPEIVALPLDATVAEVKQTIEESGHSRVPVYEGTLDHVVGILYARDLLRYVGQTAGKFDMHKALRPPFFVPESKPLRDLLSDFRLQKVHIAIVLDEYGGTAGLVTIEDVLEELVGDISDEHEAIEPAMFHRNSETSADADARIYIDELNRLAGMTLPEDAGYDTLGGFVSTTLGRIPAVGEIFEHNGARFTILDAEPQKVNRVRIELVEQPAESMTSLA